MLNKQIDSVQVLRGFAAILVMFFHYYGSYLAQNSSKTTNVFIFGATGVDLFFIISGFIMYLTIDGRSIKVIRFFTNRLIRIWPLYFIATVITVGPAFYSMNGLKSMLFYPFKVPDYPVLSQGWTLVYEIYFYLLISLLSMPKFRHKVLYLFVYYGITLLVLPNVLGLSGTFFQGYSTNNVWLNLIVSNKNAYFFMGFIFAFLYRKTMFLKMNSWWWWGLLFIFSIAGIIYINYDAIFLHGNVFSQPRLELSLGIFFLSFVLLFRNYNFNKLLLFLGNASYSLYLWQYFSIGQAVRIIGELNLYAFILGIILNIVVSFLSYKYIEQNLTKYIRVMMNKLFYQKVEKKYV